MLNNIKINMLLPINYNICDFNKIMDRNKVFTKKKNTEIQNVARYDSEDWFDYCFRYKPIGRSLQLAVSPLTDNGKYLIRRIELNQSQRESIGIHKNENVKYMCSKSNTEFKIGKIRVLFTQFGIAFIHFEIIANDLTEEQVLDFTSSWQNITTVKFSYKHSIAKGVKQEVSVSLKNIITRVLELQTYIPFDKYGNKTFSKPYMQIFLSGNINSERKGVFFEMLRTLSKSSMTTKRTVNEKFVFSGKGDYISRFVGERTVCIYGDVVECGERHIEFITGTNGLVKTATENYTTVYAYLIALQLMIIAIENDDKDKGKFIDFVCKAPVTNLSEETNISGFFDKCLCKHGWELAIRIEKIKDERSKSEIKEIKKEVIHISGQVDRLVEFAETELASYLKREKSRLKTENLEHSNVDDIVVGNFVRSTSDYIGTQMNFSSELVMNEKAHLQQLFGSNWKYLMSTSQTSLISAGVLWKSCVGIKNEDFDFSGICICATSALEAELRRIFFDGLIEYMVNVYGEPCKQNAQNIYKNWPEELLSVQKFKFEQNKSLKLTKVQIFTMGKLPYLFGWTGKLSDKLHIRKEQLAQSDLMKKRMAEYLETIVEEQYKLDPLKAFVEPFKDSFVDKCESIRKDYRNKAAHVDVIPRNSALGCYERVIGKMDAYSYNSEITGVLLELYAKIDGNKLDNSHSN